MNRSFYTNYLKSPQWRAKRELWFAKFGKWCRACGRASGPIQLHHLTYERLGRESLSDLIALCTGCHQEFEKLYRRSGRGDRRLLTLAFIKNKRKSKWKKK